MSEAAVCNDIQINIVLEESLQHRSDKQTVRMVGFVMIVDVHMKLSNLRTQITEQFDDEQLQIIGINFKFLKKNFPVSSKQETAMQINNICIKHTSNHTPTIITPNNTQPQLSPIQDTPDTQSNKSPKQQPNKNGLILHKETEEKTNTTKQSQDHKELQPFDVLPHHYQYISSPLGISSPIMNASYLPTKNTSQTQNEEAFPTLTIITAPIEPNDVIISVMVRACHKVLSKHKSLSVFTSFEHNKPNKDNIESSPSPKPIRYVKETAATASFIASYPLSPKLTRLETQHNEVLPRIRANSSNQVNIVDVSTEVDSILKNAMVTTKNVEYMSEYEFEEEGSFTISVNETTMLHPIESNTQRINGELIDYNIKSKFTVIGSPILNGNDDCNVIWEFDKATDLIKGLGGVHHSSTNPLWIDLVCDRHTFINIAEHIRPSIHNLTIEDCLTIDCREKLEIFNEYLFICLKHTTHTINILIFKSMIITYHLGDSITNHVINDSRFILNKKFGNICPSPSWVGHTIIDNVIDKMMPEVESRVREVETCEQFVYKLSTDSQNELLRRMQNVRSWMVLYRSRLWPKSTITHNLLNNSGWRKEFLCDVPLPYWRDINDHVARMVDLLNLATQTLESIQNIFVAKINLEQSQQSNKIASVGGKLAGVGAVFLPLTVITGIWGMNCRVPFQYNPEAQDLFADNLYGFIIVMLIMLLTSIVTWKCVNQKGMS